MNYVQVYNLCVPNNISCEHKSPDLCINFVLNLGFSFQQNFQNHPPNCYKCCMEV